MSMKARTVLTALLVGVLLTPTLTFAKADITKSDVNSLYKEIQSINADHGKFVRYNGKRMTYEKFLEKSEKDYSKLIRKIKKENPRSNGGFPLLNNSKGSQSA